MSAELVLQKAMLDAMKASAPLVAAIGGRVLDRVKLNTPRPYVHFRAFQKVDDGANCVDGVEIFADLDVWSDEVGKPEASRIAGLVYSVLHEADGIDLGPDFRLLSLLHRSTNIDDDDDNLLTRARMTFVALVDRV